MLFITIKITVEILHFREKEGNLDLLLLCEKGMQYLKNKRKTSIILCIMFCYAISVATNRLFLSTHICQTIHSQAF